MGHQRRWGPGNRDCGHAVGQRQGLQVQNLSGNVELLKKAGVPCGCVAAILSESMKAAEEKQRADFPD